MTTALAIAAFLTLLWLFYRQGLADGRAQGLVAGLTLAADAANEASDDLVGAEHRAAQLGNARRGIQ